MGTLLTLNAPEAAELLGEAGFDWLFVDAEHGTFDARELQAMLQGAGRAIECLIRVPALDEISIKKALDVFSDTKPEGLWAKSVVGIGPVLAAGLMAHIDIEHCPTVGHIWSFAGLNPAQSMGALLARAWASGHSGTDFLLACWLRTFS